MMLPAVIRDVVKHWYTYVTEKVTCSNTDFDRSRLFGLCSNIHKLCDKNLNLYTLWYSYTNSFTKHSLIMMFFFRLSRICLCMLYKYCKKCDNNDQISKGVSVWDKEI